MKAKFATEIVLSHAAFSRVPEQFPTDFLSEPEIVNKLLSIRAHLLPVLFAQFYDHFYRYRVFI